MENSILILDFGSQYTQLIARKVRELGVYSEIYPYSVSYDDIVKANPKGIILSGSPSSVLDKDPPSVDRRLLDYGLPILGICYGMQLVSVMLGGQVGKSQNREYGKAELNILDNSSLLLQGIKNGSTIWMSHGDSVIRLPQGFKITAEADGGHMTAVEDTAKGIYAVQFHPEVAHTDEGKNILSNFIFKICGSDKNWNMKDFIESELRDLRNRCGGKKVALGVSGGVDSTALAVLSQKALGNDVTSIFVDNGLLRLGESEEVLDNLRNKLNLNIKFIDASALFLQRLKDIDSPEEKRKIIGRTFIEVFNAELSGFDFLIQGTLYPDVIESNPVKGPSQTIKTHHNRVSEVIELEKMGKIIEPFKFLFKDEVREVAALLNVPEGIRSRHPFPGPGMAVRIIGDVTPDKLAVLRQADRIFIDELKKSGWYGKIWQAFAVFLPVKSVGVMGDERAYGNVIALRAITSIDGMTADWAKLPYELLDAAANKIIRQIKEVNRVVYDVTSKPPATIEWE